MKTKVLLISIFYLFLLGFSHAEQIPSSPTIVDEAISHLTANNVIQIMNRYPLIGNADKYEISSIDLIYDQDLPLCYVYHLVPYGHLVLSAHYEQNPIKSISRFSDFSANSPGYEKAVINNIRRELNALADPQSGNNSFSNNIHDNDLCWQFWKSNYPSLEQMQIQRKAIPVFVSTSNPDIDLCEDSLGKGKHFRDNLISNKLIPNERWAEDSIQAPIAAYLFHVSSECEKQIKESTQKLFNSEKSSLSASISLIANSAYTQADYSGDFVLTGAVQNNGTDASIFTKINVVLYDANNNIIGTDFTYIYGGTNVYLGSGIYTNALCSGEKGFFKVWTSYSFSQVDHYTYTFEWSVYSYSLCYAQLSFNGNPTTSPSSGDLKIVGQIKNSSANYVSYFTQVNFAIYNSNSQVIDTDFTYVDGDSYTIGTITTNTAIYPGQSQPFTDYTNAPYSQYSTYEYSFEWDEARTQIPAPITVTAPNGGESWQAGTTHDITWAGSTAITNVKIELSFNGGDLWSTIITSTPNDGSYSWDIVKVPSLNCFMRISDVLGTSSDTSDAPFVLQSPPSLTNNYFILPVKWTDTPFGSGGWYVGDYDGDGRSDLLRYLLDGTRNEVLLSTGSAFAAGTNWLTADHGADGWHVGDYNGDGRSDLMRYVPGVSGAQVFLSNGSNFIYSGSWIGAGNGADGWYVGDYNGDGRDDIMRYVPGVSGADVFLSDGTKFNYSGNWSGAGNGADGWYIGDFNGDGRSDLMRYYPGVSGGEVFLSDGTKFTYSGSWTGAGNGDNGWYLGKFRGTARTDIMRYVLLLSGADVFLNTGSGFTYDGSWTPAGRGDNDWHVGDFNGDGRDDLMRSIVGVTGADVLISNASGGATLSGKPLATQTKGDKGRWLGDVPFSEKEWDGAEEKAFVAAVKKRLAGGEELSVYQIQKEYEKLKGKACRRVSIMKLLKHYQWDSMYRIKAEDLLQ